MCAIKESHTSSNVGSTGCDSPAISSSKSFDPKDEVDIPSSLEDAFEGKELKNCFFYNLKL